MRKKADELDHLTLRNLLLVNPVFDTGAIWMYQYRSILVHTVSVSVDTEPSFVYPYRSILERVLCTSIGRYWNVSQVSVKQYRSLNWKVTESISMYQYREIKNDIVTFV